MLKSMTLLPMLAVVLAAAFSIGNCVEKCKKNMEYSTCGSRCPKTCKDVANMGSVMMCPAMCVKGCFCKKGYVLNSDRCVPESTCPCSANAHYSKCGSPCPLTCEKYKDATPCKAQCVAGCTCNKGYVRSGEAGKCVRPKDCPPPPKA